MLRKKNSFLLALIFSLSIGLRFFLALVNSEANDNHFEVIQRILNHLTVNKADCWECYHPKLFYYSVVEFLRFFSISNPRSQIIAGQMINCFLGIATLIVVWFFVKDVTKKRTLRLLTFSLFALNPVLIGINAQLTNDTLIILLATCAILVFWKYLKTNNLLIGLLAIFFAALASLAKASGIVLMTSFFVVITLRLFRFKPFSINKKNLVLFLLIPICFIAILFIGPYYQTYKTEGDFFSSNWKKSPPLQFIKQAKTDRPGATSIVDAFFTFRIIDLIKTPYIPVDPNVYPLNRTSLWSQLYGRGLFVQFDQWPSSWRNTSINVLTIGRIILLVGLVPLIIMFYGLIIQLFEIFSVIFKKGLNYFSDLTIWIFPLFLIIFLAMEVFLSASYRDFASMKAIYVFPALVCLVQSFICGYEKMNLSKKPWSRILIFLLVIMICFFIIDILVLIIQLWPNFVGFISGK